MGLSALLLSCATASPERPTASSGQNRPVTQVAGRLEPSRIQYVVRSHFGKLRVCYQAGLAVRPQLRGRINVRFVIGREGKVTNVADGGSDLPDADVVECVLKAFYTLQFPEPDGGIVTVVYPILLAPE